MSFDEAMKNPSAAFTSPEALDQSTQFSASQKSKLFKQWQDQLTKLLIADDEGMLRIDATARVHAGANADSLRRVTDVMARHSRRNL